MRCLLILQEGIYLRHVFVLAINASHELFSDTALYWKNDYV